MPKSDVVIYVTSFLVMYQHTDRTKSVLVSYKYFKFTAIVFKFECKLHNKFVQQFKVVTVPFKLMF